MSHKEIDYGINVSTQSILDAQLTAFRDYAAFMNYLIDYTMTSTEYSPNRDADYYNRKVNKAKCLANIANNSLRNYLGLAIQANKLQDKYVDTIMDIANNILFPKLETDTQIAQYVPGLHSNQK